MGHLSWTTLALLLIASVVKVQNQTMDELIVNAADSSHVFDFFQDTPNRMLTVEYDIVLSEEQYSRLHNRDENLSRKKRAVPLKHSRYDPTRWPNNIVYYQIDDIFTRVQKNKILSAMQHWAQYTCLRFVQSTVAPNRIRISDLGRCSSRVGMTGSVQLLSLTTSCFHRHIIIHEIGHAVGLFHEQTKPDRDNYVRIIEGNIKQYGHLNFEKLSPSVVQATDIPYDYRSIMHYGKTAFSISENLITIQTENPYYQDIIGQAKVLSFRDIKTVNKMYNCHRRTAGCSLTDADCPDEGFVGMDCTCWCEGGDNTDAESDPIRSCSGPQTQRPTRRPVTQRQTSRQTDTACRDRYASCRHWAAAGECNNNRGFMNDNCKASCRRCSRGRARTGRRRETCVDFNAERCERYRRWGYCIGVYRSIVVQRCPRSCDVCTPEEIPAQTAPCEDTDTSCPMWARYGQCQHHRDYMASTCRRSCGLCEMSSSDANNGDGSQDEPPAVTCVDENASCGFWEQSGLCQTNRDQMSQICPAACGFC